MTVHFFNNCCNYGYHNLIGLGMSSNDIRLFGKQLLLTMFSNHLFMEWTFKTLVNFVHWPETTDFLLFLRVLTPMTLGDLVSHPKVSLHL